MQKKNANKSANAKISASTSINTSSKENKVHLCIEWQLKYKHMLELEEIILALYCNEFVNSIDDCTTNTAKVQVNPLLHTLWINSKNGRNPNICMY